MLALPEGVVVYLIVEPALVRAVWGFQALFGFFCASRGFACMMYVSLMLVREGLNACIYVVFLRPGN